MSSFVAEMAANSSQAAGTAQHANEMSRSGYEAVDQASRQMSLMEAK